MSRGLGRMEWAVLHRVYHEPRRDAFWGCNPTAGASTRSEAQSLHRAARSLVRKGLVRQVGPWANNLEPVEPTPLCVANCVACAQLATHRADGGAA